MLRHPVQVGSVGFSSDGRHVLTYGHDHAARLWNSTDGEQIRIFQGSANNVYPAVLSPDGTKVLAASSDGTVRMWDIATGRNICTFDGQSHTATSVRFAPDGRWVFEGRHDHTVRLVEVASGRERCRLITFWDGAWAVIAPDGRFDASDLDRIGGLHWVIPDDPFRPLPIEVFMRDYYEPRLLARILADEKFAPIRSLQSLNRVQPSVKVTGVAPQQGYPDEVVVTVEVADQSRDFNRNGMLEQSGVFDVRLFRDGQLVGYHPSKDGIVRLGRNRKATLRFEHIKLPRRKGKSEVELSAYAFNSDRVKSVTHRVTYRLPEHLVPRKGVAYVICVGVNAFDSPSWDLRFAANDARSIGESLSESNLPVRQFEQLVTVSLISDTRVEAGRRLFTENTATKARIRAVFALLAGHEVDCDVLQQIPGVASLRKVRPEDLVLILFSTHGHNGDDGKFYLFPSDIGSDRGRIVDSRLLDRAISIDDLSRWLRDVDAGKMVMIVDACHSAASVETEEFKPGPMGSRGFGQLAYNKRMRILTASQAEDVAFENPEIRHGLLTYALCGDGLRQRRADFEPEDHRITMGEWLRYGVSRVPILAEEIATGGLRAISIRERSLTESRGPTVLTLKVNRQSRVAQLPALFDFTREHDEIILTDDSTPARSTSE